MNKAAMNICVPLPSFQRLYWDAMHIPYNSPKVYNSTAFSVFTELYSHHHSHFRKFHQPSYPLAVTPTPFPIPKQPLIYFLPLYICQFCMLHINKIISYVVFCTWLLSLNVFEVHPRCSSYQRFIPIYGRITLQCMDRPHLVYPLISGWTCV